MEIQGGKFVIKVRGWEEQKEYDDSFLSYGIGDFGAAGCGDNLLFQVEHLLDTSQYLEHIANELREYPEEWSGRMAEITSVYSMAGILRMYHFLHGCTHATGVVNGEGGSFTFWVWSPENTVYEISWVGI